MGDVMPYAENGNTRIYYTVEGTGPAVVMQHGGFGSGEDWREFGFVETLKRDYRVILVDARGHGMSGKPHDPAAYDLVLRAGDVLTAMDAAGVSRAHYVGYSMGGWIGFGLARAAPQRFTSMVLGGAHPWPESMAALRNMMPADAGAFVAMAEPLWKPFFTPALRDRMLQTDCMAQRALLQDRVSQADLIPAMRMPCLLYAGDRDPRHGKAQECAHELPNGRFFTVPGCDHIAAYARGDLVLPEVAAFLSSVG
jgi:pimeloyl-ACP methyl ester carboxylesterase